MICQILKGQEREDGTRSQEQSRIWKFQAVTIPNLVQIGKTLLPKIQNKWGLDFMLMNFDCYVKCLLVYCICTHAEKSSPSTNISD